MNETTGGEGENGESANSPSTRQSVSPSSSQLADSALSSLRKTLASQRPTSPATVTKTSPSTESQPRQRTTLEDRLRAKFAIGDASNGTSPSQSIRSTPSSTPIPVVDHPLSPVPPGAPSSFATETDPILSPKSIPLPDSPLGSLIIASPVPETAHPLTSIDLEQLPVFHLDQKDADGLKLTHSYGLVSDESLGREQLGPKTEDQTVAPIDEVSEGSMNTLLEEIQQAVTPPDTIGDETDDVTNSAPIEEIQQPATHDILQMQSSSVEPFTENGPPLQGDPSGGIPPETKTNHEDVPSPPLPSENASDAAGEARLVEVNNLSLEMVQDVPVKEHEGLSAPGIGGLDIDGLQERLKLVEQRFAGVFIVLIQCVRMLKVIQIDVSTSFKRLQAEKVAADRILKEFAPIDSITEADALRDFLQNMNFKNEVRAI